MDCFCKGAGGVSEVERIFFYLYSCINLVAGMCVTNDLLVRVKEQ